MIDLSTDIKTAIRCRNGRLEVERIQDVEPYLEKNKAHRNDFVRDRKSNLREIADIPMVIVERWMKAGINVFDKNDFPKIQRMLNSNEYAFLRTSPGKCVVKAR